MVFNPQIGDAGVPNYTGVSKGTGPNRTFEALFSGLNETFQNVTTAKDTGTQMAIEREAREGFEQVNQEFGFEPPPGGFQDDIDHMSVLKDAFDQGKISSVNYYGRLATLTKQLRTRYPRYENVIDSTIQSVTGTRPANAYRDAILSEIQSAQNAASDEVKFRRQWEKENQDTIAILYPDYFQNPDAYDFTEVRSRVARVDGEYKLNQSALQQLELQSKQGSVNDQQAQRVISQDLAQVAGLELDRAIGANGPNIESRIQEFLSGSGNIDELTLQLQSSENQMRTALRARAQQYVTKGLISQDKANEAIEAAMFPLTEAKKAIVGGDYKAAGRIALLNKYMTDRQLNDVLKNSPEARAGAGLSELSKQLGDTFLSANQEAVETIALEVAGRAMVGSDPSIIKRVVESGDQKVARQSINSAFDVLVDPKVNPDQMSNLIDQFFGPNAIDFMSPTVVNSEDILSVYTKFLDPSVTQAIATKGSPEDFRKYRDWAFEKFRAIPEFRAMAGNITDLSKVSSQISLQYDPKANRIDVIGEFDKVFDPLGSPTSLGIDRGAARHNIALKSLRRTVGTFNRALAVLSPIAQVDGSDPQMMLGALVSDLVPLEKDPGKGFYSWMVDQLETNSVSQGTEGSANATGESVGEEVPDGGEIDFEYEREDYDSSFLNMEDEEAEPTLASFAPESRPSRAGAALETQAQGQGLEALVSSRKRGYSPDLQNLRPEVATGLTKLQEKWGRPLPIVSGYRDPARNRKAGGAKRSQHMHGNAVDIDVSNLSRDERIELIKLARQNGWGGVGVYANSIHLDLGNKRSWGPSYKNASLPKWARPYL